MKHKKRINPEKVISFLILLFFSVLFVVPIIWVFLSAFKVDAELNRAGGFLFLPKTWTLQNFKEVLDPQNVKVPIYKWFGNSVLISSVYTCLSVVIVSMAAYAYGKLKFKGRDTLFLTILFISSFPAIVNIVPLYHTMRLFRWVNTPMALIFPGLAGCYHIFLVKQFMIGIPDSVIEAGKIDGAGDVRIFFELVFPMLKPILVVVGIFSFTGIWNDFLWPSVVINDMDKLPLTAGLQLAKGTYATFVSKLSAVAVVSVVPMIALYCIAEKWLVKGVQISAGVKG